MSVLRGNVVKLGSKRNLITPLFHEGYSRLSLQVVFHVIGTRVKVSRTSWRESRASVPACLGIVSRDNRARYFPNMYRENTPTL